MYGIQAFHHFQLAFSALPQKSKSAKRLLTLLIPLSIMSGRLPSQHLLKEYAMPPTIFRLLRAVRTGDMLHFERILVEEEASLIKLGIFLAVERCRLIVFRTCIKKLSDFTSPLPPFIKLTLLARWLLLDRPDRFPLSSLLDVLTSLGARLDMPQIECFIANIMQMVRLQCICTLQLSTDAFNRA